MRVTYASKPRDKLLKSGLNNSISAWGMRLASAAARQVPKALRTILGLRPVAQGEGRSLPICGALS